MLRGVEENSSHPLARAAVSFSTSNGAAATATHATEEIVGKGLKAAVQLAQDGHRTQYEVLVGNEALLREYSVPIPQSAMAEPCFSFG